MESGTLAASAVGRGSSKELEQRTKLWSLWALTAGLTTAAHIFPVFWFRRSVQDRGWFPDHMLADLGLHTGGLERRRAGILPGLALIGGVVVLAANWFFQLPA